MQEEGGWGREPLRMGLTFVQNVADDVPIVHCQSKCCVCVCACSFFLLSLFLSSLSQTASPDITVPLCSTVFGRLALVVWLICSLSHVLLILLDASCTVCTYCVCMYVGIVIALAILCWTYTCVLYV